MSKSYTKQLSLSFLSIQLQYIDNKQQYQKISRGRINFDFICNCIKKFIQQNNMGRNIKQQVKTKALTKTKQVKAVRAMSESNKVQVKQFQSNVKSVSLDLVDPPHNQMGKEIFTKQQLGRVAQFDSPTRSVKRYIKFERPYPQETKPNVYAAIGSFNCDRSPARVLTSVQDDELNHEGFMLTVFTYKWSMVHHLQVVWFSSPQKKTNKQFQSNVQNVSLNLTDPPHNQMGKEIFTQEQLGRIAQIIKEERKFRNRRIAYQSKYIVRIPHETRSVKRRIQFGDPYPQGTKPNVYTALGSFDCNEAQARVLTNVQVDEVDNKGFQLTIYTYKHSVIHYAQVLWFSSPQKQIKNAK